ncbi:MAG: energy-coupling factor ABC transporter permease [Candidatus Latescibacterota bacterium]
MHVSAGILSARVLAAGGLLASAYLVASLVHVPLGPASVHRVLTGPTALLLGWTGSGATWCSWA